MLAVSRALAALALLSLLLLPLCAAQSATQTLYWQYTITNGTSVFGSWSVCAGGSITVTSSASSSNALSRPAFTVLNITGQRVFTNGVGSTVQNVLGLLGNDNANLNADDLLYSDPPHVDSLGIAYLLDSPVIYGNGVFAYPNVTIWPQAKTESYAPEGLSAGLQVSASPYAACSATGSLVWSFSYTVQGSSGGQPFTICTTGLIVTSQATSVNGQQQYSVLSASGSRQVTIGSITGSGNTVNQTITGVASTSTDNAANVLLTSSPFLTSGGITLQLSTAAVYPAGASTASYVTVQLINGVVLEKAGPTAAQVSSSSAFQLLNSQTFIQCPAQQSFSFCFYTQSALPSDTAASSIGSAWSSYSTGVLQTSLALQSGGNHPNPGAYTPLAQYYTVTNITGTRVQTTTAGSIVNSIVGLAGISVDYVYLADNRLYTTFPWLDEYGLLYTLNASILQVGSTSSSNVINLYGAQPVEGDSTAAFAYFSYQPYTAGAALPSCSLSSLPVTTLSYQYTTNTAGSLLSWSSCVSATLTVVGPYPTVVSGRNAYTLLNATGSRTLTINGASTVQRIIGVTDDIGDQTVYDSFPYSIYDGGIAFVLDSPAVFPGFSSAYPVLYVGTVVNNDGSNAAYTVETDYEANFTAGVISSISIASGVSSYSCPLNSGANTAATLTFSWTYTVTSPAANSTFGSWSVCASGLVTVSNSLLYPSPGLPAYQVIAFNGTRVFTNSQGSTLQLIQSLLGNDNANLAADNLLYAWSPFIDVSGIAFYVDSPIIYANGVYQYNNATIWPLSYRNTVESYSPAPQVSTGLQVSTGPVVTCPLASQRVWAWSYTLTGSQNGQSFTICAAGLIVTTTTTSSINGQQAYSVVSINGTRQITLGTDLSPTGNSVLQNVIGLGSTSLDSADNAVLVSSPFLTSGGITLLLNSPAVYPAGTSGNSFVTVLLSNGVVVEKAGAPASSLSSNGGFQLLSSQTVPLCPATQAFSFCYASQGAYSTGQPWSVVAYGTFQTPLATQVGGNHEDGAYLPVGSFYTLTSISGTRVQTNLTGSYTQQIVGLAGISVAYEFLADNRIWTTFPWLSEYGWLYQLNTPVLFPGAASFGPSSVVNLCEATPIEMASPNWAFLSYSPYTPGSAVPACPAAFPNTTISIGYVTTQAAGQLSSWSSCVNAVLTVQGPYPTVIPGRQAYTLLSAYGTRVFTLNGQSSVQSIIGTSSVDLFDNNVYTAFPYVMQYGGFSLLLSSNVLTSNGSSTTNILAVTNTNNQYVYETNGDSSLSANSISSISFTNGVNLQYSCSAAAFTSSSSSGLTGGQIAGIVIGTVVGALLLLAIILCVLMQSRGGKTEAGKATRMNGSGYHSEESSVSHTAPASAAPANDNVELQSV